MSVEEFYAAVDGDLDGVRVRLMTDERIAKFVGLFKLDPTYQNYYEALEQDNLQDAFRAAHTMKGTSRDLGFMALYEVAHELADVLRPDESGIARGPLDSVPALNERLNEEYNRIIDNMQLL